MQGFKKAIFYCFIVLFTIVYTIDKCEHILSMVNGSDISMTMDCDDAEDDDSESEDSKVKESKSYFVAKEFPFKTMGCEALVAQRAIICNERCYASTDHSQAVYSPPDMIIG
ncbi:MAG: hypothetical protein JNJ58_10975 [Chitinophagaceae bacterium]|nr:hypothetical protein [Chitinophagaceae bacterium]